jgi:F-type H+-transporting ATPase subunit epsilon
MRLTIATPLAIVVDSEEVAYVRAEDETGAFGILPGHADFLTVLAVSVVTWRYDGRERHIAVRGGLLRVSHGARVSIVTREAVGEDTLEALGPAVLARLRSDEDKAASERLASTRMELAALRQIQRYLATGADRLQQAAPTRRTASPDGSDGAADSGGA